MRENRGRIDPRRACPARWFRGPVRPSRASNESASSEHYPPLESRCLVTPGQAASPGRGARDPAHRGVLRRVPAPEERGGDRRSPERARPPDSHGGHAPLPDDPETIVPVSFKVAHEIKPQREERKLQDLVGGCAAASSSTAAGSCISGLAARAATGAGRALPRPDRGAGSLGPRLPVSRVRRQDQECSTTCAPCSTRSGSTSSATSRTPTTASRRST